MAPELDSNLAYQSLDLELHAAELEAQALLVDETIDETADDEPARSPSGQSSSDGAADEAPSSSAITTSWQELFDAGAVESLLERAAAYRAGSGVERDLEECYHSYQAAAELGSGEGMFAAALFKLSGAVVAEDVSAGTGQLRKAAAAGSLRAKIYLANMYELGVGREPDRDKADVWYRSSARAAEVKHEPDDREYTLAMAELGSIRHARMLLTDAEVSKKDQVSYLAKAKSLGYGLHQRNKQRSAAEQKAIAREIEEAMKSSPALEPASSSEAEQREQPALAESDPRRSTLSERAAAIFFALVFVAGTAGGGLAATRHAYQLLAQGAPVPVVGARVGLIVPLCVALGLLPALLVYQARTVALAVLIAVGLGAAGWISWASALGPVFTDRLFQSQVFGLTGLVVALLLLGLAGGTRKRRWKQS